MTSVNDDQTEGSGGMEKETHDNAPYSSQGSEPLVSQSSHDAINQQLVASTIESLHDRPIVPEPWVTDLPVAAGFGAAALAKHGIEGLLIEGAGHVGIDHLLEKIEEKIDHWVNGSETADPQREHPLSLHASEWLDGGHSDHQASYGFAEPPPPESDPLVSQPHDHEAPHVFAEPPSPESEALAGQPHDYEAPHDFAEPPPPESDPLAGQTQHEDGSIGADTGFAPSQYGDAPVGPDFHDDIPIEPLIDPDF